MTKPSFIFIGPSKSGSTWIFELLKSHPEIFVPIAKDIYFFDKFFDKGVEWYERHFKACKDYQLAGELSHDYFSSSIAIDRISRIYPGIKLICCLRNPFERAISSYKYFKRNGLTNAEFRVALQQFAAIVEEGKYYTHLQHILSKFRRDQLLILYFEDLSHHPEAFAKDIFDFLGVASSFHSPVIGKKLNASASPRFRPLARAAKASAVLVRKAGFPNLVGYFKRNQLVLNVLFTENKNASFEELERYEFPREIVTLYNQELEKLEQLLNRDFSDWKRIQVDHKRRTLQHAQCDN